jgi:uridine kinase
MQKQPYVVGITGGSASGKTSFARNLKELFGDHEMIVLSEDNYYLPIDKVPVDKNGVQNYDVPESLDHAGYAEHVKTLKSGNDIEKLEYTFHKPGVVPRMMRFSPTPIIILEGIFSLHIDAVKDLIDLKLYIDADPETRLDRRLKRDLIERGLDRDDVEYRWNNHIAPQFEQYHRQCRAAADMIIQNNINYQPGLNVISAYLREVLLTGR